MITDVYQVVGVYKEHLNCAADYCGLCQKTPDILTLQRTAAGALVLGDLTAPPEVRQSLNTPQVLQECLECSKKFSKNGCIAKAINRTSLSK